MIRMAFSRLAPLSVLVIVTTMLMTACGDNKQDSANSSEESAPVHVKLYLSAPQVLYAGIFAAESQGYFEDETLDVEILFSISAESSVSVDASLADVESGGVVFADSTAETLLLRRQGGSDVVALLAFYQRDSRSIISLSTKNIATPADLVDKRVLVVPGTAIITNVFLQATGIDASRITLIDVGDHGIDWIVGQILSGEVDALVYSIEGAAQFEANGFRINRIAYHDYGVQSYPDVIFTSRQLIEQNPAVVQRFVNAVVRGMQYAVEQPDAVAKWFVENYSDSLHPLQVNAQDEAMLAIVPLIQTANSKPGVMVAEVWEYVANSMVQLGQLDATVNPDDAYTAQFMDEYYKD